MTENKTKWTAVFLTFLVIQICSISTVFCALSKPEISELNDFKIKFQENVNINRIGYLVMIQLTQTLDNDDRVLKSTGRFYFSSEDGYLVHVDIARLMRLKSDGVSFKILDKKLLDDHSESWYLLYSESSDMTKNIQEKFEPLYTKGRVMLVRIRPSDQPKLLSSRIIHQLIDEELLPPRTGVKEFKIKLGGVNPDIIQLISKVSVLKLVETVQTLQDFQTRFVTTDGNASTVAWLKDEFGKIPGLKNIPSLFHASMFLTENVIFEKTGILEPKTAFIVMAHIDSTASGAGDKAPGADDNGTGAAAMLEIARLLEGVDLPYTVYFVGANAEEIGLVGSAAFAKELAKQPDINIKAVFNMDMLADIDDNEAAAIGDDRSKWLVDLFKEVALIYAGLNCKPVIDSSLAVSDHASFWNIGVPALFTREGHPGLSPYYHSIKDTVTNLAPTLLEKIAKANLATLLILNTPMN
ncbi:MAG: Zn-dependent exopeptidase M28 [Candidatus Riflebacteria bacterium]|nr:Zn-dependent exopeptidase M28 [Candidatus Riflebacteria bacterium]